MKIRGLITRRNFATLMTAGAGSAATLVPTERALASDPSPPDATGDDKLESELLLDLEA